MADILEAADRVYQDHDRRDFRPVMDLQTFDFLQTITNAKYTRGHWAQAPTAELIAATSDIQFTRLSLLKVVKEQMGLTSPVL